MPHSTEGNPCLGHDSFLRSSGDVELSSLNRVLNIITINHGLPQLPLDVYIAIGLVIATPGCTEPSPPLQHEAIKNTHGTGYFDSALGLGLDAPPEHLRVKVAETFGGEKNVPPHLNLLLKRLGLSDLRSFYIRFGHEALATCEYCHSFGDFALYAFPGPCLNIFAKSPSNTTQITNCALSAAGARCTPRGSHVRSVLDPHRPSHVSQQLLPKSNVVLLRHTLFLLLPLLLTLLPSLGLHRLPIIGVFFPASDEARRANLPPPQFQLQGQNIALPADATLASTSALTMQTLQHLVPTLHLLKYANAAIMRLQSSASASGENKAASDTQPSVHARATKWWAEEAREGQILRDDADLTKILKAAGLGVI
ncbi:hypothetical protein BJ912DRAFT_1058397 [Pholiota molesta]|nr:hypothetical protein BJ912DRAFT_1058397 [Pholiota molesta]